MGQYLIRTLTDSTGHKFTHVTKARDNETFTVVKAESKEEAKRKYVLEVDDAHWEGMREELSKIINKYIELAKKEDTPLNIRFMPISEYRTMIYKKGQWVNMKKIEEYSLKVWGLVTKVWISFRDWVCRHIVISTIVALILIIVSIFLMVSGYGQS